jgi:hypothetical protein
MITAFLLLIALLIVIDRLLVRTQRNRLGKATTAAAAAVMGHLAVVHAVESALAGTTGADRLDDIDLLLPQARQRIVEQVTSAEARGYSICGHDAGPASRSGDPQSVRAYLASFAAARAIVDDVLATAVTMEREGEYAFIPLVVDLRRRLEKATPTPSETSSEVAR